MSNSDAQGHFIEDEIFGVKGVQKVRKKGTSAGKLMASWRQLRDGDDEEAKAWLSTVEVMQQPAAFCDSVIVCWIAEMRRKKEANSMIVVRDMFAGGLSASCVRMSAVCDQLRTYIAGKMTAVMQLTDTGCAFGLKYKGSYLKKPWRIATDHVRLAAALDGQFCRGDHSHAVTVGKAAKASEAYPPRLARCITDAFLEEL